MSVNYIEQASFVDDQAQVNIGDVETATTGAMSLNRAAV